MKQTLEQAMESYLDSPLPHSYKRAVEFGAKWQKEQDQLEIQDLKNRLDTIRENATKTLKMVEDLQKGYNQEIIDFAEWICEKAEVPYIKGKMHTTFEIYQKEKGL
jgi:hypothetical protein